MDGLEGSKPLEQRKGKVSLLAGRVPLQAEDTLTPNQELTSVPSLSSLFEALEVPQVEKPFTVYTAK